MKGLQKNISDQREREGEAPPALPVEGATQAPMKAIMGYRRKARECALQILYQADIADVEPHAILSLFWKENPLLEEVQEFAERLVNGIWRNKVEIDTMIGQHSTHWRLDRMSIVDRNILRIGAYELLFEHEIATNVTLNEAIELAKHFGTEDSGAFVNGILDQVAQHGADKK